jgi:hypothetical protein
LTLSVFLKLSDSDPAHGTPITARFIAGTIGDHQDQLKVTPFRKVKS